MNTTRKILMILGVLVLLIFVFADYLGIGVPGFGYKQIIGSIAGVVIVLIGLLIKKKT